MDLYAREVSSIKCKTKVASLAARCFSSVEMMTGHPYFCITSLQCPMAHSTVRIDDGVSRISMISSIRDTHSGGSPSKIIDRA